MAIMNFDTAHLLDQLRSVNRTSLSDEDARLQVLSAARALCRRLETPYEWVLRMTWEEPTFNFCLKIADDLQLYKQLGQRTSQPKSAAELAGSCNADPALLRRILRHLAGKGVVDQVANDVNFYRATELSEALSSPEGSSGVRHVANLYTGVLSQLPSFLKSTGYNVPRDNRNGPFQQTMAKAGQTYFEWMQEPQNKDFAADFNMLMGFAARLRTSWMDVFPPDGLLQVAKSVDAPVLVDVGGSLGTDVVEFRRRYPNVRGKVILQELPHVIASAKDKNTLLMSQDIECQEHDFFTPELVYGARIYFMGSVLHDWPDQEAQKILHNIVPAMTKGYSKLLLSENAIPKTDCHPHLSALDLTMMTFFGSEERTEEKWRELLESEGLQLMAIHTISTCLKSVLEVERV